MIATAVTEEQFVAAVRPDLGGRRSLASAPDADRAGLRVGSGLHLRPRAAVLRGSGRPARRRRRRRRTSRRPDPREGGGLDHHRPHLARGHDQAGLARRALPDRARRRARGLQLLRSATREPRGDDAGHVREHPPPERARAGDRGPVDDAPPERGGDERLRRRDAVPRSEGAPLGVLAGKEYGSGSSRDWAAKGPALLGVRFVLAESFERIHRQNLVGMGILPLQYKPGESAESHGLTGRETFSILGLEIGIAPGQDATVAGHARGRVVGLVPGDGPDRSGGGGRDLRPRRHPADGPSRRARAPA